MVSKKQRNRIRNYFENMLHSLAYRYFVENADVALFVHYYKKDNNIPKCIYVYYVTGNELCVRADAYLDDSYHVWVQGTKVGDSKSFSIEFTDDRNK